MTALRTSQEVRSRWDECPAVSRSILSAFRTSGSRRGQTQSIGLLESINLTRPHNPEVSGHAGRPQTAAGGQGDRGMFCAQTSPGDAARDLGVQQQLKAWTGCSCSSSQRTQSSLSQASLEKKGSLLQHPPSCVETFPLLVLWLLIHRCLYMFFLYCSSSLKICDREQLQQVSPLYLHSKNTVRTVVFKPF